MRVFGKALPFLRCLNFVCPTTKGFISINAPNLKIRVQLKLPLNYDDKRELMGEAAVFNAI